MVKYIYSLWFKGHCFYVGRSENPAARLFQHINATATKMSRFMYYLSHDDVSIKIHERVKVTKRKSYLAAELERKWINKMVKLGEPLLNDHLNESGRMVSRDFIRTSIRKMTAIKVISRDQEKKLIAVIEKMTSPLI